MTNRLLLAASLASSLASTSAIALTISPTDNASVLANNLLGGEGVTVTGTSISGDPTQSGEFTDGVSSGIGIESGIILSSGDVRDAVGPNGQDSTSTDFGGPGAAGEPFGQDASVLDISFTTTTGDLFFNYVFASEEYNEFTNSQFNDSFSFLLNGTAPSDNIALIPGTNTPVEINTVNGGNPLGTDASNAAFFNNNDPSDGIPSFDIEFDGFTDVFTAAAIGLDTSVEHTISLIVQDVNDGILDSAVFLQAGSFAGIQIPSMPDIPVAAPPQVVPLPASLAFLLAGLAGLGVAGRMRRT